MNSENGGHKSDFDILVIGAGLSGVSAAFHLQKHCPDERFAILEAREAIGGTWDLFRYPGIRSDSDMFTLGFGFRPWPKAKAIADGASIRRYVADTARDLGIEEKIRFGRRVVSLDWSSEDALWTIVAETNEGREIYRARFVLSCAGYYRYEEGYTPEFAGTDTFKGEIIHPQRWPEDYDYAGKRVVIIGSGATAVTLAPAMAETAGHVTMLQRSPSYFFSMPATSGFANFLKRVLPESLAFSIVRWQRVLLQQFTFKMARRMPKKFARQLIGQTRANLPEGYDVDTHFRPTYDPWDQRLCVVPDADLFREIGKGRVSITTDHIDRFEPDGIRLKSGEHLPADLIVTATGLVLQTFGGAQISVDGETIEPGSVLTYKGALFEGIPNYAAVFGYTNASWTLRADLVNSYICRLINYMRKQGHAFVTPVNEDHAMDRDPFLDFTSGYVTRVVDRLPKQGAKAPWRHPQDYFRDLIGLRHGKLNDGVLTFSPAKPRASSEEKTPGKAA